ncbi:MAG: hypothetical protein Q9227_004642 [Pyrenula ochraceoflavens]
MKFLLPLFVACATASFIGTPSVKKAALVERDAATVTSAIASIQSATQKLSTAVKGFNGAAQAPGVQSASEAVVNAIKSGTKAVQGSGPLSQTDALTLTEPVQNLGSLVQSTVNDVISKKSAFDSAGVGSVVLDQLKQQRDASKTFSDTVTSKVPQALQAVAANLASPINNSLNKGVNAYQGESSSGGGSSANGSMTVQSSSVTSLSDSTMVSSPTAATTGGSAGTTTAAASTSETGVATTAAPTSGSATASATVSQFSGAAMPTALADYGVVVMAALAAVAAL